MHKFRVTVEPVGAEGEPLQFEVENHDDILAIARRMPGRFGLGEQEAQAFAIGLKLFGETVLKHRTTFPFDTIRLAMSEFMKAVKGKTPPPSEG